MPRLSTINPASATGKAKELFEGPLKAMQLNIFKEMANSPAAVQFYLNANQALGQGVLTQKEREVIQLAISQQTSCDYCLAAHTHMGKGAGLTEAQTIGARRGSVEGDAKLTALSKFVIALHEKKGHLSDGDVQAFRTAGYNDAGIAEAIAMYSVIIFTNYFNHVNQTVVDLPAFPKI